MRIAFGCDSVGHPVGDQVIQTLQKLGHDVTRVAEDGGDWVDVGRGVAQAVVDKSARRGVTCCSTGTGVAMAANKVVGARAAVCPDAETAELVRLYNHANVIALSLDRTSPENVEQILTAFLTTPNGASERASVDRLEV